MLWLDNRALHELVNKSMSFRMTGYYSTATICEMDGSDISASTESYWLQVKASLTAWRGCRLTHSTAHGKEIKINFDLYQLQIRAPTPSQISLNKMAPQMTSAKILTLLLSLLKL